jgi:Transposase
VKVLDSFPTCPIPEIARLGRTLNAWKQQFLAYFTTQRANNGGTEAINGIIELTAGSPEASGTPTSRITPQVVGTSRRARGCLQRNVQARTPVHIRTHRLRFLDRLLTVLDR